MSKINFKLFLLVVQGQKRNSNIFKTIKRRDYCAWLLYLISFSQLCKLRPRLLVILLQKRKKKDISARNMLLGSFLGRSRFLVTEGL